MLTLRSSAASPFVRKVKIAAYLAGVLDRINEEPANTADPEDSLRGQNPLGKIPTLLLEDGSVLYDSRVIVEYIDHIGTGGLIPKGPERFAVLCQQALADGLLDACVMQVYEKRMRPEEMWYQPVLDYQAGKVSRALEKLEHECPALIKRDKDIHIGHIAIACALGYLDLRFAGEWRKSYPNLEAWLASFEKAVPLYTETRVEP